MKFIKKIIGLFKFGTKYQTMPEMLSSKEMFQEVLKSPYSHSDQGIQLVQQVSETSIKIDLDNPDDQSKGHSTAEIFIKEEKSNNLQPDKEKNKRVSNEDRDEIFSKVKSLMEEGFSKSIACKTVGIPRSTFDKRLSPTEKRLLDEISFSNHFGNSHKNKY